MSQKKNDKNRLNQYSESKNSEKDKLSQAEKKETLRQAYLRQIEFFKSINHSGAYDGVLEFLREELQKLMKPPEKK